MPMTTARLSLTEMADGSWLVHLGVGHRPPARGTLPSAAVRALTAAVRSALDPSELPLVMRAGRDALVREAEEVAGRALAAVLECSTALARTLGRVLAGQQAVIAVEASTPAIAALPWELLAGDSLTGLPLEAEGRAVIVRLISAPDPDVEPEERALGAAVWAPTLDDPAVETLCDRIEAHHAACGVPRATTAPFVRYWVCHGIIEQGLLRLVDDDGLGAGSATHARLQALRGTPLVVLMVCHGAPSETMLGLARRILGVGATACVMHRGVLDLDMADAFAGALGRALARGAPVPDAVAAARRAVSAQCSPWPDERWHRFGLAVSRLPDRAWPAPRIDGLRVGWPPLGAEAGAVLSEAMQLAEPNGFIGVEHLALALAAHPHPAAGHLSALLPRMRRLLLDALDGWSCATPSGLRPTPRLLLMGRQLQPGDDLGRVWQVFARYGVEPLESLTTTTTLDEADPDATEPATDEAGTHRLEHRSSSCRPGAGRPHV